MKLDREAEERYRVQDYSGDAGIDGVEVLELKRFNDDAGSMTELARLADGAVSGLAGFRLAQINYGTLAPGAIKAFHVHRRQTDVWHVPPEDKILLVLVDVRGGSATGRRSMRVVLGDGNSRLVRIPPGVAHGCRNLGSATGRIIYFTDQHFSAEPDSTDEGRLPWDLLGPDIWNLTRE